MISQKIHLLIICGFSLLLTVSFYFDWWNYDAYFPSSEQIVSIALSPSGLDDVSWQNEASEPIPYPISDVTDARLGTIKLTGENKETALDWLKPLRQENLKAANAGLTPLSYIVTAYTCNDKTTLYRKYPIYQEETYTSFSTIYDMMEFKARLIPLCSYDTTGRQHFIWSNGLETYHLNLTQEENEALLAAYRTDAEQRRRNL